MKLGALLQEVSYTIVTGSIEIEIDGLSMNSREELKNHVFVCIQGTTVDGHQFAVDAMNKGASAIVVEKEVEGLGGYTGTILFVEDTKYVYGVMSAAYFHYPARELTMIGVTGTKGKTTTTYMIQSMLQGVGLKTGLIGTIETIIDQEKIPSENTTPEAYTIHKYLRKMVDAGCKYAVMEVSSQGLKYERTAGILFDYGIFTNLEEDHIGPKEHADFEEYLYCKSLLFQQCKHGIVNKDDPYVERILAGHTCEITTYGVENHADVMAHDFKQYQEKDQLGIAFYTKGLVNSPVRLGMPGTFNVYNALTAIALCYQLSIPTHTFVEALAKVQVRGRMEIVPIGKPYVLMIDYAHNALSLKSLLLTLREYQPNRLVCLFGCGGNRSKLRRYEMGEISARLADLTVVTSDNPRFEEPMDIIADIQTGIKKAQGTCVMIADRREAIRYCMEHAQEGDFVILAGKGHEDYQEIKGAKYPMDERIIIQEILNESKSNIMKNKRNN
ncbi:UDP-N-acetylmuramoyl-L-alanyl-D-glutamate--2,6-diaminopimelate ligase [Anaerosporobacter faecicola]|uniref:UDP-N-acetylmuramoyl-L-alanyl-D-glutamate--2, 6-diaminopimelate ligase n=1 Tax=Anaerosporobacter faecicola TaxID=2718714 RepID=UPI00143B3513|nr:UDP-N-acetylmuramoyl-L-alanyl-D-glutamate--2,6-diaminopimelate ligase [Anaerosporobacter faecicola]